MMRQKFPHVTAKKHSGNWAGVGHVANGSGSDPGSTKFHEIEIFKSVTCVQLPVQRESNFEPLVVFKTESNLEKPVAVGQPIK